MTRTLITGLAAAFVLAVVPAAHAGILYVATNGVDSGSCGAKATPCRSITQGIANAGLGDHIIVGPGSYTGEPGALGCACFVAINKSVVITSSDGAASTVLDARQRLLATNVLVIADGVEFGRPGQGFTVTNPKAASGAGIAIDGQHVKVQGNQVINDRSITPLGTGIAAIESNPGPILIAGNQVMLWETGIDAPGAGKTVSKNEISLNSEGIEVRGASDATGNVVSGNQTGIFLAGPSRAVGNAAYGNLDIGIFVLGPFTGAIARNNVIGNGNCGLSNEAAAGLIASNNYWGASTGPGPNPADDVCNADGGTTTPSPFATRAFSVRAPIRP